MSKRENEAVVNRFLLSTLFLVVLEFGFYLFNNIANDLPITVNDPKVELELLYIDDLVAEMLDALEGKELSYEVEPTDKVQSLKSKVQSLEGELVGGNISVLYSLLGSDIFPDTRGKILFLEDLDEYLYHIDRMMFAFERAGKLDGIKGLVVGGLTKMHDNTVSFGQPAEEIIWERVRDKNIPVIFDFPAGHIDDNRALILGRMTEIEVVEKITIKQK